MNKFQLLTLLLGMLLLGSLTACSNTGTDSTEDLGHNDDDNHGAMHVDPPDEFAAMTNPFNDDHEAIEAGEEIFQMNCAACHGPGGQGDGPAAEALDPKPPRLADGMMMRELSDGYLFWRVSKGGQMEPFNSAMPAWEAGLTEDQRWQVISYVRTLADADGDPMDMDDDHQDDAHD